MWAHYADNYSGMCVEYDFSKLSETLLFHLYPVYYSAKRSTSRHLEWVIAEHKDLTVCHAGTKLEDGKFLTAGGRVLGVTAYGDTLKEALDSAYKAVDGITFEKAHFRHDIGKKALSADK